MGIMKHKKVKALLSAALVLSLVGGNNLSYVGAKNQQDIENTLKIEEQTNNAEQESEAEKEIPKEENEIPKEENDQMQSTPEESVEKDHIEDVEVIPAMPETESEKAETLEKNPEKVSKYGDEIPEITDRAVLDSRAPSRPAGNNQKNICQGGGWKNEVGNPYITNKPNQNPKTNPSYWHPDEYSSSNHIPFIIMINEVDLIDKYWPKVNHASGKDALYNAVMDPEYNCGYANPNNGWGQEVTGKAYYRKYNPDWTERDYSAIERKTPFADPNNHTAGRIAYAGNYMAVNGSWENPFTIVTRPKLDFYARTDYYVRSTGKNARLPDVRDVTVPKDPYLASGDILYKFSGEKQTTYNEYPTQQGRYTVEVQTPVDRKKFKLPGRASTTLNIMKKGYFRKFRYKHNGVEDRFTEMSWNQGSIPSDPDKETRDIFGKDLYLENMEYTLPEPVYDKNLYIFEGWEAEEEYVLDNFHIGTRTMLLQDKDGDERYEYNASKIGENAYYVLTTTFYAKLRNKKTETITPQIQVDGGELIQGALKAEPTEIKVIESEENSKNFTATINTGYAYDFVGWSYDPNGNHNDLGVNNTYKPNPNFDKQNETNKHSTIFATFKPKEYTITFDGNGGTDSTKSSTTSTQTAKYYNDVQLAKNPFVREGFEFKGWSKTKNGGVDFADQGNGRNIPLNGLDKASNNDIPTEITLYAVWERNMAKVKVHKHKDTLWFEGARENAVAGGVYVAGNSTSFNVYEITRFYLDVLTGDANESAEQLNKTKFYVVWERSTDGGKNWTKINTQDISKYITKAFTDNRNSGYSKAVYDAKKGKWFVPLLVRYLTNPTESAIGGQYRVSVAYDDPKATDKVTSEQDYYSGKARNGWTTSEPTEIKMISTFDTVIKVPSTITLAETTEVSQSGEKTDVIKSVPYVNEVTVNPVRHTIDGKTDYDWHTPNTAMDGKTTQSNSYNGGQYTEYTKQKPFKVSVNWDKTLTDTTKQYTVNTVEMYSAENIGTMKKDQKITTGTQSTFSYDGQESGKKLFSFYLKGEKPKHLPEGVLFKGQITFVIDNVR